jgi:FkbM family methyltransferase
MHCLRIFKTQLKRFFKISIPVVGALPWGDFVLDLLVESITTRSQTVSHKNISFVLSVPNHLCKWRAATFSSKEPETLEWIDSWDEHATFWDIGANIGLYSLYAARAKQSTVYAFEPSVYNLTTLVANIAHNSLQSKVHVCTFPLSNKTSFNLMQNTATSMGSALSTFGESYGWDGQQLCAASSYSMLGLKGDDIIACFSDVLPPDYVKIDVDGIEHLILSGMTNVLSFAKEVLIEVNDNFHEQRNQVHSLLCQQGFVMSKKSHSDYIAKNTNGFQYTFNQIWTRSNA